MKQWDKINWPALNRRAREIEAELWQWSLAQHDLKENSVAAPITQAVPYEAVGQNQLASPESPCSRN